MYKLQNFKVHRLEIQCYSYNHAAMLSIFKGLILSIEIQYNMFNQVNNEQVKELLTLKWQGYIIK
mgnify:CR=1 FL=1